MKTKVLAFAAVMMVLTGSMAFAAAPAQSDMAQPSQVEYNHGGYGHSGYGHGGHGGCW